MNEMVTTAAASTLALLVLYVAGLVFILQVVSDRYAAAILGPLLRQASLKWAAGLTFLAILAYVLMGVGIGEPLKAAFAGLLLLASLVLAIVGSYRTWLVVGDRATVVRSVTKLPADQRLGAVREIIWNAISRSDVEMVEKCLHIFNRDSDEEIELLSWLLGQKPLANRDWLGLALGSAMVDNWLTQAQAKAIREPLISLLQQAFFLEELNMVYEVIDRTMTALRDAAPFTDAHGQLMLDVARSIWRIGDHRGDAPRTTSIPSQLEHLELIYAMRRKDIFHRLIHRKDRTGLTAFVTFLGLSLEDTGEDLRDVYSLLCDVVEDGRGAGILEPEAIQNMANAIGRVRLQARQEAESSDALDKSWAETWEGLGLDLARALIDLGADDGDVQHMLGNYRFLRDGTKLAAKTRPPGRSSESERRLIRILKSHG
jgi:hypothetical protein